MVVVHSVYLIISNVACVNLIFLYVHFQCLISTDHLLWLTFVLNTTLFKNYFIIKFSQYVKIILKQIIYNLMADIKQFATIKLCYFKLTLTKYN